MQELMACSNLRKPRPVSKGAIMPSPNFRSFRDLDGASLAQKLSLGVTGTTSECNAERVDIAATLERQRLAYIYEEYTQHESHEHLSADYILPPDPAIRLVLRAQGDIQKILNDPQCAADLIGDVPDEVFYYLHQDMLAEVSAAVEELHRDYGINFTIGSAKDLKNAPLAQQISLGVDGSGPDAVSLRQERARLFRKQSADELANTIAKVRSYSPFPGSSRRSSGANESLPTITPSFPAKDVGGPSL